jgi:4-coumarate--CoA ligase (photoactive yellow protein activation family)
MRTMLDQASILRIMRSLLGGDPLGRWQDGPTPADAALPQADWLHDDRGRIACATAVSTFFHVHEAGLEDRLLAESTLEGWAGIVQAALAAGTSGVTVHTSGSTGAPRACTHLWARLEAEVGHWATLLADRRRVVSCVPSHHLYGLIFTVLLPARLGVETLDARAAAPDQIGALLRGADLVVGGPLLLTGLASAGFTAPEGLALVSACGPLQWEVADALFEAGAAVHDVYGSTETGGIALRTHPAPWHRLLPFWRAGQGGYSASVVGNDGALTPLPDRVVWTGADTLRLDGRKDAAVQVAGADVYPAQVAACIAEHPMVAECSVRLDTSLAQPRLKAAVVPCPEAPRDASRLVATLEAFCRARFTGAERPVRIDIMPALPRSVNGKSRDWGRAA